MALNPLVEKSMYRWFGKFLGVFMNYNGVEHDMELEGLGTCFDVLKWVFGILKIKKMDFDGR